jgi:hypothetical protein
MTLRPAAAMRTLRIPESTNSMRAIALARRIDIPSA